MSSSGNFVSLLIVSLVIAAFFCGTNAKPPKRIWKGSLAPENEFIATVSQGKPGYIQHNCGAGIIGPRHILTAAHCLRGINDNDVISVRAGVHDIRDSANTIERIVKKIIIEPNYVEFIDEHRPGQNDIAMLVLEEDLPIGDRIGTYLLPTHRPEYNTTYFVAGWGKNSPNPVTVQYEMKVLPVTLADARICSINEPQAMCAVSEGGAICQGDSGSPLIKDGYIYGIASTGTCSDRGYQTFVNVYNFLEWINNTIKQNP